MTDFENNPPPENNQTANPEPGFQPPTWPPPPEEPPSSYQPPPPTYVTQPPVYPMPPEPPQKTRRVGSITMAISLIVIGVLLVLRIFVPHINYILIAQCAPVVLVFLGLEILISNIRHKDEKLKYDVLSVFICIILILVSLFAAVVPEWYHRTVEADQVNNRLARELERRSYEVLQEDGRFAFASVEWYVDVSDSEFTTTMLPDQIAPEQYVQVRVFLGENYDDATSFAQACKDFSGIIQGVVPHLDYASFYSQSINGDQYAGDVRYTFRFHNQQEFNASVEQIAQRVTPEYWIEEGYYVDEQEYEDRLENPENYGLPAAEEIPEAPALPEPESASEEAAVTSAVSSVSSSSST